MPPEYTTYLIAALNIIGYWFLFKYQKDRINQLETGLKSQNELLKTQGEFIKGFDDYRKILDVKDFNEKLALRLSIKDDELDLKLKRETKNIFEFAHKQYESTNQVFLDALNEMLNHAVGVSKTHLKEHYVNKQQRDAFFVQYFPKSSSILIYSADELLSREVLGSPSKDGNA